MEYSNTTISFSLSDTIEILNKTQSLDRFYGVYDTQEEALTVMLNRGLTGRLVAVYTDKENGKVQLYTFNKTANTLDPLIGDVDNINDDEISEITTWSSDKIVDYLEEIINEIVIPEQITKIPYFYEKEGGFSKDEVVHNETGIYKSKVNNNTESLPENSEDDDYWELISVKITPSENTSEIVQMAQPTVVLDEVRKLIIPVFQGEEVFPLIFKVNGIEFIKYTELEFEIPDAANSKFRKDLILANAEGDVFRYPGIEGDEIITPNLPANTILLTDIILFGDGIFQEPSNPILNGIYIKKPNDWVNISNAGNNSGLYDISEVLRAFNITRYYGSGKVTGFALGISGNNPFLVQTIRIKNSSEDEIPLEHNSADLVIPFWFENEEDYILKPTEILTLVLKNGKFEIVSSSLGGSNVFEQDITVSLSGGKRIGKYGNGETIPCQGWTFEEWARDVSIEYLTPSFTSFGITQTTPIEVGTVISGNKNFTFGFQYPGNVEDDSITIIDVTDSNNPIGTGGKTSPVSANIGSITKTAVASHQWKATAVNTLSNTLESGLATVSWQFRYFRGAVSAIPSNGSDLRTAMLSNSIISNANTFSFTTGTTHKDFVIAIPSHKTLVEAKNMGTNENLPFVLSGTITTVPDAGETPRAYKVYTFSGGVPFSSNYNINVTLS